MDIEYILQNITALLGGATLVLSILAFLTSLFVELIKATGIAEKAPMQLITYIIGILVAEVSLLALSSAGYVGGRWYYFIIAMPVGIMVAQVAMNGWDNLKAIWDKVQHESVE